MPPPSLADARLDVLAEAILFLVRHGVSPNLADASIADLDRTFERDEVRRGYVAELAAQFRDPNTSAAENEA